MENYILLQDTILVPI